MECQRDFEHCSLGDNGFWPMVPLKPTNGNMEVVAFKHCNKEL